MGNKGIFSCVMQLGAATLGKDLSDFTLVDYEMYPAVWQCAKLAMGTEVSCLEHTSLKRAQRYGTVSSFTVQRKPNPAFIRSVWPWSNFISLLCCSDALGFPTCEPQNPLRNVSLSPIKPSAIFTGGWGIQRHLWCLEKGGQSACLPHMIMHLHLRLAWLCFSSSVVVLLLSPCTHKTLHWL